MNHGQQSGEAKHEDDPALTEFLASLMDYTPTVKFQPFRLFVDWALLGIDWVYGFVKFCFRFLMI